MTCGCFCLIQHERIIYTKLKKIRKKKETSQGRRKISNSVSRGGGGRKRRGLGAISEINRHGLALRLCSTGGGGG